MEIFDNVVRVLMYIALGLNIWGMILSRRTIKKARESWKQAMELSDELSELQEDYRKILYKGEEQ